MADETTPPPEAAPTPAAAAAPAAPKPAPPKKVEATDAAAHPWVESVRRAVPDSVLSAKEFARQVTLVVDREKVAEVARHLKDAEDFRYCVDVTAVDWRDRQPRFDVVYHFYSFSKNDRILVMLRTFRRGAALESARRRRGRPRCWLLAQRWSL